MRQNVRILLKFTKISIYVIELQYYTHNPYTLQLKNRKHGAIIAVCISLSIRQQWALMLKLRDRVGRPYFPTHRYIHTRTCTLRKHIWTYHHGTPLIFEMDRHD